MFCKLEEGKGLGPWARDEFATRLVNEEACVVVHFVWKRRSSGFDRYGFPDPESLVLVGWPALFGPDKAFQGPVEADKDNVRLHGVLGVDHSFLGGVASHLGQDVRFLCQGAE